MFGVAGPLPRPAESVCVYVWVRVFIVCVFLLLLWLPHSAPKAKVGLDGEPALEFVCSSPSLFCLFVFARSVCERLELAWAEKLYTLPMDG